MRVDINLSEFSKRFLWELACKTQSSTVLDRIVEYAINIDHYKDKNGLDEDEFYLEAAAENSNLSKRAKYLLIKYEASAYVRWAILERKDLDSNIIHEIARSETDISLISYLMEKHELNSSAADIIASRITRGEITADNCIRSHFDDLEMKKTVRNLIFLCSNEFKSELELWLNDQ